MSHTPGGATPAPQPTSARVTTPDDLVGLRRLVARTATAAGLPADRLGRLILAVNEVAANAIKHGGPPARATVTSSSAVISVAVHDHGPGFGPDPSGASGERAIVASAPTATAPGGRGLWLATNMADRVSLTTDRDGTTVTVTMAIGSSAT